MSLNPDRAPPALLIRLPCLPRSLHMSGCLPSTVQAYENEAVRQWGMGMWVVLLVVVVRGWRRRRKGMGEQGEIGEEKKKPRRQSFLAERWQSVWGCVWVCVCVFCNFRQFGRGRRSVRANNSLQTADVITFWQTSQSGVTFMVLNHTHLSLSTPPQLCAEVSSSRGCLGLLQGFDYKECAVYIILCFWRVMRNITKRKFCRNVV